MGMNLDVLLYVDFLISSSFMLRWLPVSIFPLIIVLALNFPCQYSLIVFKCKQLSQSKNPLITVDLWQDASRKVKVCHIQEHKVPEQIFMLIPQIENKQTNLMLLIFYSLRFVYQPNLYCSRQQHALSEVVICFFFFD